MTETPEQAAAVRELLATGRPQFTGPVPLLQGGQGFLARVPVCLRGDAPDGQGRPWGLATVIIDAEAFFREAGLPQTRSIRLAVSDEELAGRRAEMEARGAKAWQPENRDRHVSAALRAYAAMTTSADTGAVRDVSQVE